MEIAFILRSKTLIQNDELGDLPLYTASRHSCDKLIQQALDAQPLAVAIPDVPLQVYIR